MTEILAWVYILTNQRHTVLYVGATIDIKKRIHQHQTRHFPKAFTAKYNCTKLVYYEEYTEVEVAFTREEFIKKKNRKWKEQLISTINPDWKELRLTE